MKGIVVDIDGKKAAAMTDDGDFVMLPEGTYEIGQEVEIPAQAAEDEWQAVDNRKSSAARRADKGSRSRALRRIASIAAAFAVVFAGIGTYAYASPYGVVSLDVNPSIEYTINRFDRVLSAESVGDSAAESIDLSGLKNKKIDAAVSQTLGRLDEAEFLEGDRNYVVMAASTKSESHTAEVTSRMDSIVAEFNEQRALKAGADHAADISEIKALSVSVSEEEAERARTLDTTPGKLWLVKAVRSGAEELDGDDLLEWLSLPVRQIIESPDGKDFRREHPDLEWPDDFEDNDDLHYKQPPRFTGDPDPSEVPADRPQHGTQLQPGSGERPEGGFDPDDFDDDDFDDDDLDPDDINEDFGDREPQGFPGFFSPDGSAPAIPPQGP